MSLNTPPADLTDGTGKRMVLKAGTEAKWMMAARQHTKGGLGIMFNNDKPETVKEAEAALLEAEEERNNAQEQQNYCQHALETCPQAEKDQLDE